MRLTGIFVGVLLAVALVAGGCGRKEGDSQASDPAALRAKVVKLLQEGRIKPDATGLATLPAEVQSASAEGRIYVSTDSAAGLLAVFPLQGGTRFGRGLLYSEKTIPAGTRIVKAGNLELMLMHPAGDHWYEVAATSR